MLEVISAGVLLALVHTLGGKLRFIEYVPRSKWLSAAGGVSVSYVFVHLLPELAESAETLAEAAPAPELTEHAAWLLALAGLALFYGIETVSRGSRGRREGGPPANTVFWFSMTSYAIYNALIGYLLHERRDSGSLVLVIFAVAMALHFLVNDFALREHHQERYARVGRWLLVASIALGIVVGAFLSVPEWALAAVVSFIAGGIVLNVLKEELPREAESSFTAFAAAGVGYAALLVVL